MLLVGRKSAPKPYPKTKLSLTLVLKSPSALGFSGLLGSAHGKLRALTEAKPHDTRAPRSSMGWTR